MRASKLKIAVTPEMEYRTVPGDDGSDALSFHHHNVLCKGHTHLARAVQSYPVRMNEQAVVGNNMFGSHPHDRNGDVETGDGDDDDDDSTASPSRRRHHSSVIMRLCGY